MVEDYNLFIENEQMRQNFQDRFSLTVGQKYIKLINDGSVKLFIVLNDGKKFNKGDILKPANWNTPMKNKARGNIFGDYVIKWTGPLYLR